ncbi:hypothetical protein PVK06_048678 [Gossypium arboreum]|uniref:Uncharacterized protein n=1 Tax=Gossypium arboreum TaxID=29729 RepID=A0ABR0MGP5_GOSAR|nr:hypothetical protein PVK06_048678 [Gossypium arboreum]
MYNDDHYFKSYESNQSIDLEPKAPLLDNEAALDNTTDQAIENNNVIEEEKWGLKITTKEEEVEEIVFIGEDKEKQTEQLQLENRHENLVSQTVEEETIGQKTRLTLLEERRQLDLEQKNYELKYLWLPPREDWTCDE